jgi:uncharacterized protein (DUF305 family)
MMKMMGVNTSQSTMMENDNSNMMNHHEGSNSSDMSGIMDGMSTNLKNKSGDEFDRAFITEMIAHHQGAIDMANLALTNANHQEIKDMAKAIINAQSTEISQMKNWQQQWFK